METSNEYPVLEPGQTYSSVTAQIADIPLTEPRQTPRGWILGFFIGLVIVMIFLYAVGNVFIRGVGLFGINIPVGWGFDIINFVWWIGIGHAGTLISAILLLLRQDWRTSINRFAEAMTLFAVANAAMFPILHLGRPWIFFYLIPYPNSMGLWPQFRSPLVWDVFAITTYATVSFLFWYMGLVPDLATMRDRAKKMWMKRLFGVLSFGWRSSARHWNHFQSVYFLMAALATPLVLSVHSIVGMDFAYGVVPGWHSTIFPPYFVAGAVFSGFAMVLTLMIPLRKAYHLEDFITQRHLDAMAKVMLAMGLIVGYGYLMENFMAYYGADPFEIFNARDRFIGAYAPLYWTLLFCNVVVIQLLWFKSVRSNNILLWIIALLVNVGMWLERFIIIVQSLSKDFIPSSWHLYSPTIWDISVLIGTIGLFLTLIFLFIRLLPAISIFEMRELVHEEAEATAQPSSD
ncbi:MAG TPA: NrfD/PsrC family molybdoenzyme membrane anchor subunit [Anaerolineaceae bacterium]|nr:NrfD/PsrC family molybdoenzyme membrane anchor subunit [Anaerolineaceae bacterium]